MDNTTKEAIEQVKAAKQIIKLVGWTQGVLKSVDGEVCMVGALNAAATGAARVKSRTPAAEKARHAVATAVRVKTGTMTDIESYNDKPSTTEKKALKRLDEAVALLKAGC